MRYHFPIGPVIAVWTVAAALGVTQPCFASTIVDPPDDILDTYAGQVGADLDILQFSARIEGGNFLFDILVAGPPGTTALAKYNIGIDRGAGTNTFPEGFKPDASLDAAVNLVPGTLSASAILFTGGVVVSTTPLSAGSFTISDHTLSVVVPVSMFPSTGLAAEDYRFMLWSRTQLSAGVPVQLGIADFAPDEGALSLLPESSTWAMMLLGFGAIGFAHRRTRYRAYARHQEQAQ